MPNIKSAKKRVRVIAAKSAENKAVKTNLKTVIKNAELAVANNDENKVEVVKLAVKKIDQAAAKNILHKNCAARKKSHLASKLNAVG
ncbi:small subunit ribosomal protein S20 [Hydrogenoanaerobacterium saccharovorans]|uniref:Small ribosomal subunit protein bS20 n=1 Tax=Hydrogenoanaerobacterium saccharovorans TaxID=474960 RepID=A0A1H8CJC1_9FIRM|nr:30S ribosomal protein S20 [Hydrogenoanaerobacterium saccharovorans]RPF43157.1 small subunit ribosomal protein S20 [Hydrogenoanaerobacterium saccharovorans]SEM95213.1 small subunit ribosomal protein S20 [Hydrogenoanaerobacterium saccharovorans]